MTDITYVVVQHDGGWAYKLGDVFSETFASREDATAAAGRAAKEQTIPGETEAIQYEDADGKWHDEVAGGDDRPNTTVA